MNARAGMEFDNFKAGGQMGQLISHSVPFRQGRAMYTTSPLLAKEGLSFGMLISNGLGQLFTDLSSFSLGTMLLTHLPNPTKKSQSRSVTYVSYLLI